MSRETLYRYRPTEGFEVENASSIVELVERYLTSKEPAPFAICEKQTGNRTDYQALREEHQKGTKPLVGYGGYRTFPFISDPNNNIRGAFAIHDKKLIYGPYASTLHCMRDSFTWALTSYRHYVESTALTIVQQFLDAGYPLFVSNNLVDYKRTLSFTIGDSIMLEDVVRYNSFQ